MRQTPYHYHIWYTVCILCDKQPYLDTNVYFLQLVQIIPSAAFMFNIDSEYRLFEIDFSFWVVENVSRGLGKARGSLLAHGCLVSLIFFFIFSISQPSSLALEG